MKPTANIRNTVLAFSVLAFIVSVTLYWYVYNATEEISHETVAVRSAAMANQTARMQGREVLRMFEESRVSREKLLELFVSAEDTVAVIQEIESIGDHSGASVTISSIKRVAPVEGKDRVGQVNASVGISGRWSDVLQAVELFETLPYHKTMRNLTLAMVGDVGASESGHRWQANFDISVATIQKP